MGQRIDNPVAVASGWFNPDELDLVAIASPCFLSTELGHIHFEGWLKRKQLKLLASDLDRWYPHFMLSSYLEEAAKMLHAAQKFPVLGTLIPDREVILLPAWIVAIAGLTIQCYDMALQVKQKKAEFAARKNRGLGEAVVKKTAESTLDRISGPSSPARAAFKLGDLTEIAALRPKQLLRLAVDVVTVVSTSGGEEVVNHGREKLQLISEKLDLTNDELDLGLHYYLLSQTLLMEESAMYDALIEMPNHLERIRMRGPGVLGNVFVYCQRKVEGNEWMHRNLKLDMLKGKNLSWVRDAFPNMQEALGKIAPALPQRLTLDEIRSGPATEAPSAPQSSEQPATAETPTVKPLPPQRRVSNLSWLGLTIFSFWIGRRFFGRQIPTLPSVPT